MSTKLDDTIARLRAEAATDPGMLDAVDGVIASRLTMWRAEAAMLSPGEKEVAKRLGIKPEEFVARKKSEQFRVTTSTSITHSFSNPAAAAAAEANAAAAARKSICTQLGISEQDLARHDPVLARGVTSPIAR